MGAGLKHYDATGGTQITAKAFADGYAGVAQTAEKFFIENIGDRALVDCECRITQSGSSDGSTMVRIGADTATVVPPYGFAAVVSPTGGGGTWGATGTYYYRATALNGQGETTGCLEVSAVVDEATKKVTLTWTKPSGATGYKIYRSTSQGVYTTPVLRATLGDVATYDDTGGAVGAGAPPAANTTGGAAPAYGTPPALGLGPLTIGSLAMGKQWVYWANRVIGAGTAEAGNPLTATLEFVET